MPPRHKGTKKCQEKQLVDLKDLEPWWQQINPINVYTSSSGN